MNLITKIFLFAILSFGLPIGRLFEIFIWNDRVTKTEVTHHSQIFKSKVRICFFNKIVKEIKKKLLAFLQSKSDFALAERFTNKKNSQSYSIQNKRANSYKALLFKRFLYNTVYSDDSCFALMPV